MVNLTRFEKARVLGARALQVAFGAPMLIKPAAGMEDAASIALAEFDAGVLPLTVVRPLPNGEQVMIDVYGEKNGQAKE